MSAGSRCCRSCPRCEDCPVVAALAARARRRETATAALITEVFAGCGPRELPEPVLRTLETLERRRRGQPVAV